MSDSKTILISGASGLVGRPLCDLLESQGHSVRRLSRTAGDFVWDLSKGEIDSTALDGVDVVIHLAGESVAQRWTPAAKDRIMESRVRGAELLVREILKRESPIRYISASGISYYGTDQSKPLDEESSLGDGFLASVCRKWEDAAKPLINAGNRCVFVRTGIVLSSEGGALEKMLPPFRAGVGGRIGSGRQMMSWIELDDLVRIFAFCVANESVNGPVNAVAPKASSNRDFTKALGKVLNRPTMFPVPAFVVAALFGEMGRETVLSDLDVVPAALQQASFEWKLPEIEKALRECLKK